MRERDPIQSTLDFVILNLLSRQSLDDVAIERHVQRIRAMLEFAAVQKGTDGPASTDAALRRLQTAGLVETAYTLNTPATVYALTDEGRKQFELERTRRESVLASFVESGALDNSFRLFLSGSNN